MSESNGVAVELTWGEWMSAVMVACMRRIGNRTRGIQEGRGKPYGTWDPDVVGATGEAVFAKYANIWWSCGKMRAADVGKFQVRASENDSMFLRLHPSDNDDESFVLVTGKGPVFNIRGWIRAKDGKVDKYWGDKYKTGRPAFFVPHSDLRHVDELLGAAEGDS